MARGKGAPRRGKRAALAVLAAAVALLAALLAAARFLGLPPMGALLADGDEPPAAQPTLASRRVAGVPVMESFVDDGQPKPVLVFLYGLTGRKEEFAGALQECAALGFYAVCPEAYGHGERDGDPPLTVAEMAVATAESLDAVLGAYAGDPQADTGRLGLIGFSMGGMAACRYAAAGAYPAAAVGVLCSTPDFRAIAGEEIAYSTYENRQITPLQDGEARAEALAFLEAESPDALLAEASPPMLFVNGGLDPVIPYTYVEAFCARVGDTGRARMSFHPDMGHELREDAIQELLDFVISKVTVQVP